MSTFDSIEFGRFSDDSARDNDDRVAGVWERECGVLRYLHCVCVHARVCVCVCVCSVGV